MGNIAIATDIVNQNEKVWDYLEVSEQSPGSKGFHRYRIAWVDRNGKLAEFRQDMGKAKNFKGKRQLHIPSLWEHTFAELCHIGEQIRNESKQDEIDVLELAGILNSKNTNKVKYT
jgi:hypothetical protein